MVLAPAMVLLVVTLAGGGLITYLPIQRPSGVFATVVLLLFGASAALARWRVGAIADRVGTSVLLPVSVGAGRWGCCSSLRGWPPGRRPMRSSWWVPSRPGQVMGRCRT